MYIPAPDLYSWWLRFCAALRPHTTMRPGAYVLGGVYVIAEVQRDGSLVTCEDTPRVYVEKHP